MIVKIVHGVVYATLSCNLRRACPSVAKILCKLLPMTTTTYSPRTTRTNWSRIINLVSRSILKIMNRRGKFFFPPLFNLSNERWRKEKRKKKIERSQRRVSAISSKEYDACIYKWDRNRSVSSRGREFLRGDESAGPMQPRCADRNFRFLG